MNEGMTARRAVQVALAVVGFGLGGCGGAVSSGVAVGRTGESLALHAQAAPQGASVCALQEGLNAAPGADKPVTATCSKALRSDQLWRRAMLVLAAYGETLTEISFDKDAPLAGQLEAASTGVRDASWPEVDDAGEKSARDASAQLVAQMNANAGKGDLSRTVRDAAPHVKTLCDGLSAYLETQARTLGDLQKDMEKKRAAPTSRRCGALDNRTLCVGDTPIDRAVYGSTLGHAALLEANHVDAFNAVSGFCSAHVKLEAAAASGKASKDATHTEVVEAVRSARRLQPAPLSTDLAISKK